MIIWSTIGVNRSAPAARTLTSALRLLHRFGQVEGTDPRGQGRRRRREQQVELAVEGSQTAHVLVPVLHRRHQVDELGGSAERRHSVGVGLEVSIGRARTRPRVVDLLRAPREPAGEEVARQCGVVERHRVELDDLVTEAAQQGCRGGRAGDGLREVRG